VQLPCGNTNIYELKIPFLYSSVLHTVSLSSPESVGKEGSQGFAVIALMGPQCLKKKDSAFTEGQNMMVTAVKGD